MRCGRIVRIFSRQRNWGFRFTDMFTAIPAGQIIWEEILSAGLSRPGLRGRRRSASFLDIGTNGELVVGNREFLLCGAGAAGPALEGGSVKTGMCARTGAVQHVRMDGRQFICDVIGGGEAKGICGSGIVDLIAELFLHGWVDIRGRFVPEASDRIVEREGEYAVEYAPSLYFYQCDLDEFLSTKAAAATMVEYMMNLIGLSMQDVGEFQVAGAFGVHILTKSRQSRSVFTRIWTAAA